MKTSILMSAFFAAAALAKPLNFFAKRELVTEVVVFTKTVYVNPSGVPQPDFFDSDANKTPVSVVASPTTAAALPTSSPSDNNDDDAPASTSSKVVVPVFTRTRGQSTPSSSSTSNTGSDTTGGTTGGYSASVLNAHNIKRRLHGVPDLVWSNQMASIAQQIASSCVYAHNTAAGGGGYGQNIGAGAGPDGVPSMIDVQMYDDEVVKYPGYGREPDMSGFMGWGHFTQIVWKNTVSVGCYTQYCSGGLSGVGGGVSPYFTVCNYSPPGNYAGQYTANVLAPH